ncbi:hypothetical protein [Dyadobacter sp. LHD-138]|uniref:hypothetical protein n=1 Tax=Dyadobacter sp. LHD-138 TaxID=3071413 RepID=UPI0027DFD9B1|nr:hypothetical protein [Dyadobacter sp. LHD-138]MDQ6477158.1 hypothetical protein [Dyadobacter sp. LHD-138]
MMKVKPLLLALLLGGSCFTQTKAATALDSLEVTKIWDREKHNAFPDLIKFKDYFYCTFREAVNHVGNGNKGKVRVIRSRNGHEWQEIALFEMEADDVREARLSITPDGKLMAIVAAGIFNEGRYLTLAPYVSFSDKSGTNFSKPEKTNFSQEITPSLDWIWRVTWHKGIGYGIMYSVDYKMDKGKTVRTMYAQLLSTKDGRHYKKVSQLDVDGSPNESTIRFDKNDKMYVMVRRETNDQMGVLAVSEFPYQKWNSKKLSFRLGGPNFLFLGKNRLIMGSRFHERKGTSTALHLTDLNGKVLKTIKLPSGGDNSYPGMLMDQKKLWVAYYSSHEGKSAVYLAKIPEKELQ